MEPKSTKMRSQIGTVYSFGFSLCTRGRVYFLTTGDMIPRDFTNQPPVLMFMDHYQSRNQLYELQKWWVATVPIWDHIVFH